MSHHLLQTEWWGRLKSEFGWTSDGTPGGSGALRVLRRSIGPFRLAYVPYGFDGLSLSLREVVERLRGAALGPDREPRGSACPRPHLLRWDVPWPVDAFDTDLAREAGLVPAPVRVQPPDTVILDLTLDEDALLGAMKSKTRYNIRLAEKRGVLLERRGPEDPRFEDAMAVWYRLYLETARRDRIGIHPERYYRRVIESARGGGTPEVSLYLAGHDGDVLGGIIVASWNGTSTYLYGAGADIKRNLMASYLLQWRAIRDARARGDRLYDLFGIPPADDPAHSMYGLYRFKTGFGGSILRRPGPWDLLLSPLAARSFRSAERLRRWYHHDLRKRGLRAHRERKP